MVDYKAISDEQLHSLYVSGDSFAGNELVLRYRRLVKICIRPYFLAGGDSEDLLQEGMIGLLSAMRGYDPGRGASFRTYAELCIRRRVISATRSALGLKNSPLNDFVPLEEYISIEERDEIFGRDCVSSAEQQVLDMESSKEFFDLAAQFLSALEANILKDYLDGYSYAEISQHFGRSEKSVDNAVQRIRNKLSKHLLIHGDIS